ncbi:MAG: polysaccharide deacetylase family protein [Elusimicrobia bacterium]|nr:polysaccharide deacetylase family protein [Elusimicrobiota bacterium]
MLTKNSFRTFCLFFSIIFLSIPLNSSENNIFYGKGSAGKKLVALTFDDGPGLYTEPILEILAKYNIKATFFMEASQIEKRPLIARKVLEGGFEIGSHSYSHPNFWKYEKEDKKEILAREIEKAEQTIEKILKFKPVLLRMPYGFVRQWVKDAAREKNYKIISWTFGCDWKKMSKEEMVQQYLKHLMPGAIFLMHDGGGKHETTVESLPEIIEGIQKQGYKIVNISEMFGFERKE